MEVEHHIRDISFGEDASTSLTANGPTNLATLRSAVKAALKSVGYLYVPEGRRDHTKVTDTLYLHGLIWHRTNLDDHGTRRSPADPADASTPINFDDPDSCVTTHRSFTYVRRPGIGYFDLGSE